VNYAHICKASSAEFKPDDLGQAKVIDIAPYGAYLHREYISWRCCHYAQFRAVEHRRLLASSFPEM
jgi:hypothetical protein